MKPSIRFIYLLVLSACLTQGAGAQFNVSGPGFLPDENGTNPDDPQAKKAAPKVAAVKVVKDCEECPEMVSIPAGKFLMGSSKNSAERPLHAVTIRTFFLGKTEVTHKLWVDMMGKNPSRFKECGLVCPVENVSWNDIQQFIAKLNQKTGQKYRLPSESEWEYAARSRTNTEWNLGNDDDSKLGNYAWYSDNSGHITQGVAQKLPNAFGLFDMHGNVWEWTQDCMHPDYKGAPNDGSAWTEGCTGNFRVLRGGSWTDGPADLRSAFRGTSSPDHRDVVNGFRLARDL